MFLKVKTRIGIYCKGEEPHSVLSYKWQYTRLNWFNEFPPSTKPNELFSAVLFEDEDIRKSAENPVYVGPEPQISLK